MATGLCTVSSAMLVATAAAEGVGGGSVLGNRRRDPRSAMHLGRALGLRVGYRGAGTLEYLYDDDTGEFFFIEMNTRIQVEHPVTEMVTGIDLVRAMILIAQGQPLELAQADVTLRGAAIEVRINAEDPDSNFRPSPGRVSTLTLPAGPGVRVDTMLYPGSVVPPYYDSLLAKIIVHAETRNLRWRGYVAHWTNLKSMALSLPPRCINVLPD